MKFTFLIIGEPSGLFSSIVWGGYWFLKNLVAAGICVKGFMKVFRMYDSTAEKEITANMDRTIMWNRQRFNVFRMEMPKVPKMIRKDRIGIRIKPQTIRYLGSQEDRKISEGISNPTNMIRFRGIFSLIPIIFSPNFKISGEKTRNTMPVIMRDGNSS